MLEQLGLSRAVNAVYLEAHKNPDQSVAEIAHTLGVTDTSCATALQELADLGLTTGSDEALRVCSPADAAAILISRQEMELIAKKAYAHQLAEAERFTSEVEIVVGAEKIGDRIQTLSRGTEREIATFAPGGAHRPEVIAKAQSFDEPVLARGVKSRTIYLSSIRNDRPTLSHVAWLNKRGAEVRTQPSLPIRMIIEDRKTVILPLDPDDASLGIAIYRNKSVALALQALFEMEWATATPMGMTSVPQQHGLTVEQKTLLELLAIGRKPGQIAEQLGVSDRTVSRETKNIASRLGATTPFAAGYQAAKRGWL